LVVFDCVIVGLNAV